MSQSATSQGKVKNIILYIGDGMGISEITAARIKLHGANGRLALDGMPVTGLVKTHSADNLITDSAAGATALATGVKTKNHMEGVAEDSSRMGTILECARDHGLSTGLVATSSITHATPAAFASHVATRYDQSDIASQLLDARVDVLLGGGVQFFIPKSDSGSVRPDERNLLQLAVSLGYRVVRDREDLANVHSGKLLGLFAPDGMTTQTPPEPSLAEMTSRALEILQQNKKGFFLMVEGSQIDWAGHGNDFENSVRQLSLFDDAVRKGLEFSAKNTGTLVIVTADHETGGLDILQGTPDGQEVKVKWNTKGHTGQMVPLYASGEQAILFTGVKDNTEIPKIFARLLGISPFPMRVSEVRTKDRRIHAASNPANE